MLTQEQAQHIWDAHDLAAIFDSEEETEMLRDNNPELFEAYEALRLIAVGPTESDPASRS